MNEHHVSPSQIQVWRKCKRKWAFSRTRPRTSNKYAEFGTEVHAQRERWLRDGVPPDNTTPEGRCAVAGLELLPMPGTALVEVPIEFRYGGVLYRGFADLVEHRWRIHVQDHKTCGSFDFALTAEQLLDDPQRIIYTFWAAAVFKPAEVGATWHYLRRKPPKCQPVSVAEASERIAARMDDLHRRDGLPIAQAAANGPIDPESFPRSLDHCGAYGGCPYVGVCLEGVSALERAAAALRRTAMPNLMEHLNKNAGAKPKQEIPNEVLRMIANPTDDTDAKALAEHFGWTLDEALAQARAAGLVPEPVQTTVVPPETVRKPRSDAGKPRGPRQKKTDDLLLACASGGLPADEARKYLELRGN